MCELRTCSPPTGQGDQEVAQRGGVRGKVNKNTAQTCSGREKMKRTQRGLCEAVETFNKKKKYRYHEQTFYFVMKERNVLQKGT